MSDRPVLVAVVAYGRADLLDTCLAGLGGELPVHVVDNSSDPEVAAVCRRRGCLYTDPGRNGGFAAGVNVALRAALDGPDHDILLLNPDAVLEPAAVQSLSAAMHAPGRERLAAVSPALLDENGAPQRVMWPFPHPARAWLEAVGLGRWNRAQDFAVGTALLLRREAVRDVGLFDERYFLYAEETDWQRRAARRGWHSAWLPEATARHLGGATSADPARREALFHAGTETYVRRWFGTTGWLAYRSAAVAGAVARGVALPGPAGARARRRAVLYARGPRVVAGLGRA